MQTQKLSAKQPKGHKHGRKHSNTHHPPTRMAIPPRNHPQHHHHMARQKTITTPSKNIQPEHKMQLPQQNQQTNKK